MLEIANILNNAANKTGFNRDFFIEKNYPTTIENIYLLPFFCDIKYTSILSLMLLKRYREELFGSKYLIFCSYPGLKDLFPYVSEYWSIKDTSLIYPLYKDAIGFDNLSSISTAYIRNLNNYFENVLNIKDFKKYYDNGIKQEFWDQFKHVKVQYPFIPSASILDKNFNRDLLSKPGLKVFLYPCKFVQEVRYNQNIQHVTSRNFWVHFINRLLSSGITPVLYNCDLTYDLSQEFSEKCIFFNDINISKLLSAIRSTGCLLDLFNGSSRYAITARTPFVCCEDRNKFNITKEYEIDDLFASNINKKYIFSYCGVLKSESNSNIWNNFSDMVISELNNFIPNIDKSNLPSTNESSNIIPYDKVRTIKFKKLGIEFLKKSAEKLMKYSLDDLL